MTTPLTALIEQWRRSTQACRDCIAENAGQREKDLLAQEADTWELCADELEAALAVSEGSELDNHHNALTCPHCNPQGLKFAVSEGHRCSGCGHRWEGDLKGAELCGDCWRKGQAVIQGAVSAPGAIPQWLPINTAPKLERVLVALNDPDDLPVVWGFLHDNGLWTEDETGCKIEQPTHWMPIPDPPSAAGGDPSALPPPEKA